MKKKVILIITNTVSGFVSHRLPLGENLLKLGYEVHLAASESSTEALSIVLSAGIKFHPIKLSRSGINIFLEMISFIKIMRLMHIIKPNLVHLVTIKPVLYGGILSYILRIKGVVIAISGLGYLFTNSGARLSIMRRIVVLLLRIVFSKRNLAVIFQNTEDQNLLSKLTNLEARKVFLISGSGVNLCEFTPKNMPSELPKIVIMASRLLKDKGVREFVRASEILTYKGLNVEFRLVGDIDPGNPSSISMSELEEIKNRQFVKVYGYRNDIEHLYNQSRIVVLPSYREGFPKALIEAASCGRPIITTDVPGCRDAIIPEKTGFLIPPKNPDALAKAIEKLIDDDELCDRMSKLARKFAEQKFSINQVVEAHVSIYSSLLEA